MESKLFVGVISVFVAIVILAGALMPVINEAASGETTTHITNEGSSALKLNKITSNFALDLSVTVDGDSNLVISNGDDSIVTDPNESMFILATDSAAIYYDEGEMVFIWTDENGTSKHLLTNPFTAVIADGKLTVDDGDAFDAPIPITYMFAPSSTGQYGSFTAPDLNLVHDDPIIAAGSFGGTYCYNANNILGSTYLQEYVTVSDDVLTEVVWSLPTPVDDQQIIITPLDPSILDPLNPIDIDIDVDLAPFDPDDNYIMSVPTPTYTEGDWGYDVSSGEAAIVAYLGTGGGVIEIPSTIGGYPVAYVGTGNSGETVFASSGFTATDLIVPEGVRSIRRDALADCSAFTGDIILPSTLKTFGNQAFRSFTGVNSIIFPASMTNTGSMTFLYSGFKYVTVLTSGTIGIDCFKDSNIQELLNFGSNTFSPGYQSLPTTDIDIRQGDDIYIDAELFLAPSDVAITEGSPSAFAPLLNAIPMIIIMAILMMIVGYTMIRRSN